ncbi:stage II sporulation protein M [Bacillus fonticola]|uniref:stage II sporulation protein M n=1 Tax=Bacillus fonticola TaxID=2728853 RepID=UPI0014765171|nr:stage II sporulation protein M [Bacillus fonticola]
MKRRFQTMQSRHFLLQHTSILTFVSVLVLMGVVFGAIVVNSLQIEQREDLFGYVSQFFQQFSAGQLADPNNLFTQSAWDNAKTIGLMWLLGISVVGVPVVLFFLFIKGIVLGFTVGFLVGEMGWEGVWITTLSILPQNILLLPIFVGVGASAVLVSFRMVRKQFTKTQEPMWPLFRQYTLILGGALLLVVVAAGVEAYVSPQFLQTLNLPSFAGLGVGKQ